MTEQRNHEAWEGVPIAWTVSAITDNQYQEYQRARE